MRLAFGTLCALLLSGCGLPGEGASAEPLLEGRRVADWLQDLRDSDTTQQEEARQALGQLGPGDRRAIPTLARAVSDDKVEVRIVVVQALSRINHPDGRAAIVKAMQDPDRTVSRLAVRAYAKLERSLVPIAKTEPKTALPEDGP